MVQLLWIKATTVSLRVSLKVQAITWAMILLWPRIKIKAGRNMIIWLVLVKKCKFYKWLKPNFQHWEDCCLRPNADNIKKCKSCTSL